jgi:hypothetical protein
MGILSPIFTEWRPPPFRRIVAADFVERVEFITLLVEERPRENYVWDDYGCTNLH